MPPLRFRYQTFEFEALDVHVRTLRDRQQFGDDDGAAERLGVPPALWALFGVVWASGEMLATLMLAQVIADKRILEIGCGIGLASLVLAHRAADITATDQHPDAGGYLKANAVLNALGEIPFVRTGWADGDSTLGRFDLLIGSDLLYEETSVDLLPAFIDAHAAPRCEVVIVDPGRGLYGRFNRRMTDLGYTLDLSRAVTADGIHGGFTGQVGRYTR